MSEINIKPWERPWSPKEMISNASTWSLAGDAGLLKYLEEFSEKMLSRVNDTNDRLNDLIDNTNETSIALSNATNEFMGLRNTQFIESRVYEDDETLPQKPEPEIQQIPKQTETERLDEMKKAILNGLEIIDKYYEKVEIPESDSDDDIDEPSIAYRPIDPYVDRPLPYVIGTAEWHKYWHVGLAHSSSSSETENDDEQFSESDMEAVLPQKDQSQIPGISDTESDDLRKNKVPKPVANSTFNDCPNKDMFESSTDSETGSLPPQVNTINNNFAEELAAKLGKVESVKEPEINTKPIQKPTNIPGGLFSDEPPPLDEDDMFENKNMKSGLFSGGEGLFDDINDDTDFWNTKSSTITKITPVESKPIVNNDKDIFNNTKSINNKPSTSQQKPRGLFDDEDDELFSNVSVAQSRKTIFTPFKATPPLLSDEPPELEPSAPVSIETKRKKPIGGVSMLGPNNLLTEHFDKIIKKRAPSTSDSESEKEPSHPVSKQSQIIETPTNVPQIPVEPPKISQKPVLAKKIDSIFDDNSPLFTDDIFGETSTKLSSSLFDTLEKVQTEKPKPKEKPILSVSKPSPVVPKTQMLFDDEDLFSKPPELPKSDKKSTKNTGLFDDDQNDDLFSFSINTNSLPSKKSKGINLFDPNPPELDESDAKSEKSQMSFENEASSFDTLNTGRVSPFDNEPPLLSNESSGIVKDQSTRLESSDSSFLPTMTSSRLHSTDFFQDNQSDDSLFITKAKPLLDSNLLVKSDSSVISETDTATKIEITPSGTESSLFDQSSIENQSKDSDNNRSIVDQKSVDPLGSFESSLPKYVENKLSDQPTTVEPKIISLFGEKDNKTPKIADKPKTKITSLLEDSDSDDDLFSNKSSTSKRLAHSDLSSNTPSKPLKTEHIFEDLFSGPNLAGVPDVDLFTKSKPIKSDVTKPENTNKKFDYEDNLKIADKTDPKKPLNISNKESEEVDGQISSSTSPGKLKLNFNINVAALLPGASPPRRQNLEKSTSFDSSENNQPLSPVENVRKSVEILPTQQKPADYSESVEPDSILPSVAKERARIQVKRRPSTRKARHEAIRKSAIDLNFDDQIPELDTTLAQNLNNTSDEQANKTSSKNILNISNNLNIDKPLQSSDQNTNPLSPSTDEEDMFSMPQESFDSQDDSSSLFEKDVKSSNIDFLASQVKTKETPSIFSSSDSENDLFGSTESELKKPEFKDDDLFKPIVDAAPPLVSAKSNMLQWDDNLSEEEDIFSSKKLPLRSTDLNKSLFKDDDDDIFKEASSKASSSKSHSTYSKVKKIGTTRIKKLTGDVVGDIDDPLDALKK